MQDFARAFQLRRAGQVVEEFLLSVKNDILLLKVRLGRGPTSAEFNAAIVRLMKAYEIAYGPLERPRRKYPVRFIMKTDKDGSEAVIIEEEIDEGYPTSRNILTFSYGGDCDMTSCTFMYDVLDVLVADSRVRLTNKQGQQYYCFLELGYDGLDSMVTIGPRDTSRESGWAHQPDEIPCLVIDDDGDWED